MEWFDLLLEFVGWMVVATGVTLGLITLACMLFGRKPWR